MPSEKILAQKQAELEALTAKIKASKSGVLVNYMGITAEQDTALRASFRKVGADYHLEITIDNDEGININDCEKVHRAIDPIIDECDPIEGFYYLDVSSPGSERDLRTDDHILHCIGWQVEAKLFTQKDGRKSFVGTLTSYENSVVTITSGDESVELNRDEISKLNTVYTEV